MTRSKFMSVVIASATFALFGNGSATACPYHLAGGYDPTGVWPTQSSIMASLAKTNAVSPAAVPVDTTVTSWLLNTTGVKGRSTDTGINAIVSKIDANVQQVRYTATNVYVNVTSIPDYNMGPFGGIPNSPANSNATFRITRTPVVNAGTKTATGGGAIGVLVNGVEVFNASDQQSFQNQNVWHGNAGVAEGPSLDASYSHPQQQGVYHSHATATGLMTKLGQTSTQTSPLIGFAIDGFPIYGSYASQNADGSGGIVRQTSSYQLRSIADRSTLPDGTVLAANRRGPAIDAAHPLGYYQEDYVYVAGSGLLDQYTGRFVVTPEYPAGTYAYFASIDATSKPAYPYYVGPSYYGVVGTDNLPGGTITVPADATAYVPEPAAMAVMGVVAMVLRRRK